MASGKIPLRYYRQADVVALAADLLGKRLCTFFDGQYTSAIITETEAYAGVTDKASHAFGGRFTERTKTMYAAGGTSYVYLCYGIHHLFNIVTNKKDIPHAILIRAVKAEQGIEIMLQRRNQQKVTKTLSGGPGTVSQALGIRTTHNGLLLNGTALWLEKTTIKIPERMINTGPRIGVDYAGEDAKLPYRFWVDAASLSV